jgi:Zn-dependent alcohol dehydrogenase
MIVSVTKLSFVGDCYGTGFEEGNRMKTRGALLWQPGARSGWSIEETEPDPPKGHEALIKLAASSPCHAEEHPDTGDIPLLAGLVTRTYSRDDVAQAFRDMKDGKNLRGVIVDS